MRRSSEKILEGAQIYVNHPPRDKGESTRPYQERMGVARNVHESGEGLVGDWHFPPKHALAESVFWDALNNPNGLSFSINAEAGKIRFENGRKIVESLTTLHSIDLVTRGATTRSLFESELPMKKTIRECLKAFTLSIKRPAALKLLEDDYAPMMDNPVDAPAEMSTDDAGIEAMCTMLKAAAKGGDWKKAHEVVKAFEKLLSEKEPKEEKKGESKTDEEKKAEESLKVKTDEAVKRIQETYNLKLAVMASEKVTPTKVLLKLLESATDEKSIKEAIEEYRTDRSESAAPVRQAQKPKSGLAQKSTGKGLQESAITVPESALVSGRALAEWARN